MEDAAPTTGIVYYSRSGHSKRLAITLAKRLNGTLIPLSDPKYPMGALGYMRAGYDSLRQRCVLAPQRFETLSTFDQIVICGPVWTSYPATPVRALLRTDAGFPVRVALFLTSGSHSPADKAWAVAKQDFRRSFTATAVLGNGLENTDQEAQILDQFVEDFGEPAPPKKYKMPQSGQPQLG
ncbi:MAG: hypothetical protein AB8B82_05285 [Roseovarius sp.]